MDLFPERGSDTFGLEGRLADVASGGHQAGDITMLTGPTQAGESVDTKFSESLKQ